MSGAPSQREPPKAQPQPQQGGPSTQPSFPPHGSFPFPPMHFPHPTSGGSMGGPPGWMGGPPPFPFPNPSSMVRGGPPPPPGMPPHQTHGRDMGNMPPHFMPPPFGPAAGNKNDHSNTSRGPFPPMMGGGFPPFPFPFPFSQQTPANGATTTGPCPSGAAAPKTNKKEKSAPSAGIDGDDDEFGDILNDALAEECPKAKTATAEGSDYVGADTNANAKEEKEASQKLSPATAVKPTTAAPTARSGTGHGSRQHNGTTHAPIPTRNTWTASTRKRSDRVSNTEEGEEGENYRARRQHVKRIAKALEAMDPAEAVMMTMMAGRGVVEGFAFLRPRVVEGGEEGSDTCSQSESGSDDDSSEGAACWHCADADAAHWYYYRAHHPSHYGGLGGGGEDFCETASQCKYCSFFKGDAAVPIIPFSTTFEHPPNPAVPPCVSSSSTPYTLCCGVYPTTCTAAYGASPPAYHYPPSFAPPYFPYHGGGGGPYDGFY